MGDEPKPDETRVARILGLTQTFEDQIDLFSELLGDPLALVPSGEGGALVVAGPDERLRIRPDHGTDEVALGMTQDEVRASLGEPDGIGDLNEFFDDEEHQWAVNWNYYQRGIQVEFFGDEVIKLEFHSGRYSGGLTNAVYCRYAGTLGHADLSFDVTRAEIEQALGAPSKVTSDDPELSELLEDRPCDGLVYRGWTFKTYDDGSLERVCVPKDFVRL